MPHSLRDIRRKMKAIKSTKQVTKAMELVAASKMRRAVSSAHQLRQYALKAWKILTSLDSAQTEEHPFTKSRPIEKVLALVITSDRGLCGGLNSQLLRLVNQYMKGLGELSTFSTIDFVTVGRKGHQQLTRLNQHVLATFPALSNNPTYRDTLPIASLLIEQFKNGTYDHVVIFQTNFLSPLLQTPAVKVLLPFKSESIEKILPQYEEKKFKEDVEEHKNTETREHNFEPSAEDVLSVILPQLTTIQIHHAILESVASEHSARMVAMKNATENASDIVSDLTLVYNSTRQAKITAELAELSASKAALE